MKHCISYIALTFLAVLSANAQPGIKVGYTNSTHMVRIGDEKENMNADGMTAGLTYDFRLDKTLYLSTGLLYGFEWANDSYNQEMVLEEIVSGINVNERQMDHRIVLPIRLGYELEVIPEILSFRASAGPALSWTLASSTELSMFGALNMEFIYNNIDGDLEFSDFPYDTSLQPVITESIQNASYLHKRLDLSVGGSIEALIIKNIGLEIGYDFGLLNKFRKSEDTTYRRNGLSVTFNYIF